MALSANELAAIGKSQAVIEFDLDGTIRTANDNFLKALGYSLKEIQGQHHRMFCEPAFAQSPAYQEFWAKLGRGEYQAAEYKRLAKGGKEVWIQASYNPILDESGKPYKVVKYATDVTRQVNERNEAVKLRGVVDNSDAAFMMIDRDFIVTYLNEQTKKLLDQVSWTCSARSGRRSTRTRSSGPASTSSTRIRSTSGTCSRTRASCPTTPTFRSAR